MRATLVLGAVLVFNLAVQTSRGGFHGFLASTRVLFNPNEVQKQLGTSGGRLRLGNGAVVAVDAGTLNTDTEVSLITEATPTTLLPEDFDNFYPLDDAVKPIGPTLKLELPKAALNFDKDILFVLFPALPDASPECLAANTGCGAEVRVHLADGTTSFYLDQFNGPDNGMFLTGPTLRSLKDLIPATLSVEIRPVDFSNWSTTSPPPSVQNGGSSGLSTQSAQGGAQAYYQDVVGLYALGDNYHHDQFDPSCKRMPQTMPLPKATAADVPTNKTPLILIHGYQAAGNTIMSAEEYKQFNTALCGWQDVIELFAEEGRYAQDEFNFHNLPQNILRDEYELFVFGYDSRDSFQAQATLLEEALNIFGNRETVLVAWSMGGVLAKDYVQNYPNNVKRVISLGAPYMGTPLLTCVEKGTAQCAQAAVHPLINRDIVGALERFAVSGGLSLDDDVRKAARQVAKRLAVLPAVLSYQGTRDATYQFPTTYYTTIENAPIKAYQVHRSQPNPYLTRLNSWEIIGCNLIGPELYQIEETCEVAFNASVNPKTSAFNSIVTSVAATTSVAGDALAIGTYAPPTAPQKSDELTTLQSACVGLSVDDCTSSPFDTVIKRSDLNHLNVKEEAGLSLLIRELRRVAGELPGTNDSTSNSD